MQNTKTYECLNVDQYVSWKRFIYFFQHKTESYKIPKITNKYEEKLINMMTLNP